MTLRLPGYVPYAVAALALAAFAPASFLPRALADDAAPGAGMPAKPPAGATPPVTPPVTPSASPNGGRFFDTYDANQDGKVTKEEFSGDADIFDLLDKNKDGTVTLDELGLPADYVPKPMPKEREAAEDPAQRGGELRKRFEKMKADLAAMDKNGDKKVSKEEYTGKLPFEYLDKNKDGFIDEQDMRMPGGGGGKFVPGQGAGPAMTAEELAARFKEQDKNGDGKVTKEEFPGAPERFARLDKDGDGAISPDEFKAAMTDEQGKGGRRMLMQFDKNSDGKIARDEFPGSDDKFKELDKNGDGFITEDELPRGGKDGKKGKKGEPEKPGTPTTPTEPGMPAPGGAGGAGGSGGGGAGGSGSGGSGGAGGSAGAGGSGGLGGVSGLFAALDKDRDGKLSRAEFPGTDDEWRRLDKDSNGWITPDEASGK